MNKSLNSYKSRLQQLRQFLSSDQALLISNSTDIYYLTGFKQLVPQERESFLLLTPQTNLLLHASFSPFKSPQGINTKLGCSLEQIITAIKELNNQQKIKKLFIDKTNLFVNEYESLKKISFLKLTSFDREKMWELRTIKDATEIEKLTQAGQSTAQVMKKVLGSLQKGMTELDVKEKIETELKKIGSPRPSFPTIVAFGKNSALPHHQPTTAPLKSETAVLIDMGATFEGYHGDMTRTIWFGKDPHPEFLKIEKLVKAAYQAAFLVIRPGKNQLLAKDIDQAARSLITQAGYGNDFIHTTGHGLGLDIHERLSLYWKNNQPIKPQMVIAIEPGIYLENKFGYRYENMILVTSNEAQELTYD